MKNIILLSAATVAFSLCFLTSCATQEKMNDDEPEILNEVVFDDDAGGFPEDQAFDDGFDDGYNDTYMDPDAVALPADDTSLPGAATTPASEPYYQPATAPGTQPYSDGGYTPTYTTPPSRTYPDYNSGGTTTSASGGSGTYTVQKGDTLWAISRRYGTSVNAIANANNMDAQGVLKVGTTLRIPAGGVAASPPPAASAGGHSYTVQKGDTWYSIGKRFGINYKELMSYNGASTSLLREGQVVKIP